MFKLSTFHRYGIAVLALIIIVALFWPTDDKTTTGNIASNQPQPIVIPPPNIPEIAPDPVMTPPTEEPTTSPVDQGVLPLEPEIVPEPIEPSAPEQPQVTPPTNQPSTAKPEEPKTARPSANEWQNYRVQKGKTLAQLFRDNNLQANDAFVMARVEGAEKPLSSLQQGQKIRVKANAKGEVQLLDITTPDGKTYSFARLSDGSYYRTP